MLTYIYAGPEGEEMEFLSSQVLVNGYNSSFKKFEKYAQPIFDSFMLGGDSDANISAKQLKVAFTVANACSSRLLSLYGKRDEDPSLKQEAILAEFKKDMKRLRSLFSLLKEARSLGVDERTESGERADELFQTYRTISRMSEPVRAIVLAFPGSDGRPTPSEDPPKVDVEAEKKKCCCRCVVS